MATDTSSMAVIKAARPQFSSPHDQIAFAVHAAFLADGFSLAAVGPAAFVDDLPDVNEEVGIDGWKDMDGRYGFLYFKAGEKGIKARRVLVKCLAANNMLVCDVLDLGAQWKEPLNLQINVKDYVASSSDQPRNFGDMYTNFKGLIEKLNSDILNKLRFKSEGSGASTSNKRNVTDQTSSSTRSYDIEGQNTSGPDHGISVDPYSPPTGLIYPPVPLLNHDDVFPQPGAGIFPERPPARGGGMLIGPNDPMFSPSFGPDRLGGLGTIPPGSRYDPIGPPNVPGFEPSRFVRQPRRPDGSTHPDMEFFQQGPDFI